MAIITDSQSNILDTSGLSINEFTIKADAAMFAVLTQRVYTDLISAPIREWSTNAVDACLAADLPVKFHVHLPTLAELHFSVRDYGTGLAPDDILGLFTILGESSKRNSNLYNGQFGLGRLSGLAYSSSFTVDSYHNGEHHSYLISMQDGIPIAAHLSSSLTDEPNGLKLSLPIKPTDISSFYTKAQRIFLYFTPRPTFNIDMIFHDSKLLHISDEFLFDGNLSGYHDNYILMGNVLYQIPSSISNGGVSRLVITAPIGAVSINPGRESLSLTDSTIAYLTDAFKRANTAIATYADISISSEPTDFARLKAYSLLSESLPYAMRGTISVTIPSGSYTAGLIPSLTLNEHTDIHIRLPLSFRYFQPNAAKSYDCNDRNVRPSLFTACHYLVLNTTAPLLEAVNAFRATLPARSQVMVISRQSGTKLPELVPLASEILTDLGIPFTLASSLVADRTKTKALTPREAGIYVCRANLTDNTLKFDSGTLAFDDATYYYFELNGYTPANADALAIATAFYALPVKARERVWLVGVQKKYFSAVQQLDSFQPAFEAIQSYFNANHLTVIDSTYMSTYLTHDGIPPISPSKYQVFIDEYTTRSLLLTDWYVTSDLFNKFAPVFNIPHTYHKLTYTRTEIEQFYPIFSKLQHYNSGQSDVNYYMQLEAYRERTSHSYDERGHPLHFT